MKFWKSVNEDLKKMAKTNKKELKTEHSILNIPKSFEDITSRTEAVELKVVELPKEIIESLVEPVKDLVEGKATICDRCSSNTKLVSEDAQGKEYKCPNCNKGLSVMNY